MLLQPTLIELFQFKYCSHCLIINCCYNSTKAHPVWHHGTRSWYRFYNISSVFHIPQIYCLHKVINLLQCDRAYLINFSHCNNCTYILYCVLSYHQLMPENVWPRSTHCWLILIWVYFLVIPLNPNYTILLPRCHHEQMLIKTHELGRHGKVMFGAGILLCLFKYYIQ